ncbi:SDR family oxidoreductase [Poriferisphaera sp. WC338]|uniref:SDR family oxidoreductase n=1 Tax=Poriferisphaera sp. WC338 TaxID=3425129 RepID=UPI003D81C133
MNELFDIKGRVYVVTGAGGVLAGETALYLVEQGAKIVFLDLRQEKVDEMIEKAQGKDGEAIGFACNVLERETLEGVYEKVMEKYGRIDGLINGAGGNMPGATVPPDKTIFDIDVEDYRRVVDLNLMGSVLPTIVFAKAFAEQRSGCVVNFSSMTATAAITRVPGYSNAKGAINNFTTWMSVELSSKYGDGVRVNALAPGFFISQQNLRLLTNEDGSYTERGQAVINKTPFGRFGKTDEVFGTIHYLLSDAAAFVTGAVIPVDGGFSSFSGV